MKQLKDNQMLFFMHIQKAAGTSIFEYIRTKVDTDKSFFDNGLHAHQEKLLDTYDDNQINSLKYLGGHYNWYVYEKVKGENISFTILRDPLDRAFSSYREAVAQMKNPVYFETMEYLGLKDGVTFEEYVRNPKILKSRIANYMTKQIGGSFPVLFDAEQPLDEMMDKSLLSDAKKNLKKFDFIGLQEDMQNAMLNLCYYCGFKPKEEGLYVYNERISKGNSEFELSDELKSFLDEHMKLDYELYEYAKKLVKKQNKSLSYEKVLDNYKQVLKSSSIKELDCIDDKQIKYESGFHVRVSDKHIWTGSETKSEICFCLDKRENVNVNFAVLNCLDETIEQSLKIYVNDTLVDYDKNGKKIIFDIQKDLIEKSGFVCIRLEVDKTVSPFELGKSGDRRKLGLAISNISISKAN